MSKKRRNKKRQRINFKEKKRLKRRAHFVFFIFFIFFIVVLGNVLYIEVTHKKFGKDLRVIAREQSETSNVLEADRGVIYDSQGNPLAVNVKKYKMTATLDKKNKKYDQSTYTYKDYYVENPVEDAKKIIEILGYEDDEEAKDLIMSQMLQDPSEVKHVEFGKYGNDVSLEEKQELEDAEIKGLYFEEKNDRYYPYGDFASYVIGYANYSRDEDGEIIDDNLVGELGMERQLDMYLSGVDGETEEVKDKQGVPLEEERIKKQKIDGADVYLTLDSTIQSYVHDFMYKYTNKQGFSNATTVVMDADTGAILAAEKFPSFDPNQKDVEDYQDPFLDSCYEPGSIIKTFLVSEAIRNDVWNPDDAFTSGIRTNSNWGYNNQGEENYIADWLYNDSKKTWGGITFKQGYYFSSNVAMTYVLDNVGYENWVNAMKDTYEFGIPVKTQTYSTNSCTYNPKYDFEIATTSFGQGMTANVMQILRGYSTFSGDGRMVNPYFVESIEDPQTGEVQYTGKNDKPEDWEVGKGGVEYDKENDLYYKQILTPEQNQQILELMKGATYYNTGGDFQATGFSYGETTKYEIGTKTGTAEVAVNGNYNNLSRLFSVVIMAPVDDPEIILYTHVLNPQVQYPQGYMKQYTGAIIDNTLDYMQGQTKEEEIEFTNDSQDIIFEEKYVGMEQYEVKDKLDKAGRDYTIAGEGKIAHQYPVENTKVSKDERIYLIGSDFKKDNFIGKDLTNTQGYCNALNASCSYEGTGEVVDIVDQSVEGEKPKYVIKFAEEKSEEKKDG